MASTYALPVNPTSQSYGHGHSRSHYISDGRPAWTDMNGHSHSGGGHGHGHGRSHSHAHAEVNGQLRSQEPSPYANSNGNGHGHEHHHSHDHTHDRTQSTETLKAFMSGRPRGRPRGESDLGRPPSRKSAAAGKFGFPPIQEAPAVAPPPACPSYVCSCSGKWSGDAYHLTDHGLNYQKPSPRCSFPSHSSSPRWHILASLLPAEYLLPALARLASAC